MLTASETFSDDSAAGGIAGILDVTDYVDAFALASPWLHFMNFAFSTGSAAIGLPNDAAVGIAYGSMLTDTNGDPSDPFKGFDNFFSDNEYFMSVEIGWTSSRERIIFDNIHVTLWHKDRQVADHLEQKQQQQTLNWKCLKGNGGNGYE